MNQSDGTHELAFHSTIMKRKTHAKVLSLTSRKLLGATVQRRHTRGEICVLCASSTSWVVEIDTSCACLVHMVSNVQALGGSSITGAFVCVLAK